MILRQQISRPRRGPAGTFSPFRVTHRADTIRYVAHGLAHTAIPLGLIPGARQSAGSEPGPST
jgi:hypothetical protein